tara:strand:+ start:1736 stop:1879 length:144 start_codon:yes stop_codon:yes gene_type:complete
MKTKVKNRKVEAENRRTDIRIFISKMDKKIEEFIKFFVSQIEDTYQN